VPYDEAYARRLNFGLAGSSKGADRADDTRKVMDTYVVRKVADALNDNDKSRRIDATIIYEMDRNTCCRNICTVLLHDETSLVLSRSMPPRHLDE
jgi:hypothetical protein